MGGQSLKKWLRDHNCRLCNELEYFHFDRDYSLRQNYELIQYLLLLKISRILKFIRLLLFKCQKRGRILDCFTTMR